MYRISKEFHFSASHVLTKVPPGHPCGRVHGHNYVVEFELEDAALDARGFVLDYRELDDVKAWIDTMLDHRHLNEALPLAFSLPGFEPTAEMICRGLFERWSPFIPQLVAIRVRETEKTCAEYRP